MSTRQIERNKAKVLYKKFSDAWRREKAYQQRLVEEGEKLPPGVPRLGRRPTFNMWLKMVKSAEARKSATPAEVQEFQEDIDLSWDDEDKKPTEAGGTAD